VEYKLDLSVVMTSIGRFLWILLSVYVGDVTRCVVSVDDRVAVWVVYLY
jgi:hypothetical protein